MVNITKSIFHLHKYVTYKNMDAILNYKNSIYDTLKILIESLRIFLINKNSFDVNKLLASKILNRSYFFVDYHSFICN